MDRALTTAATGLQAQQANIERISTDLANVNTDAYKRSRNEFKELMYETLKEPGTQTGQESITPVGIQRGMGVKIGSTHKIWEQGPSRMTYRPYDWMVEGQGLFQIQTPKGETAFTRRGAFYRDATGRVVTSGGSQLIPNIVVPSNALNIRVTATGEVKVDLPNQTEVTIGQLQLARFQNPEGLSASGGSAYFPTPASGPPLFAIPGDDGMGVIQQGALEGSNVNVANSMVDMISTQRAYEMGTKVMKSVDQMMQSTVNLK